LINKLSIIPHFVITQLLAVITQRPIGTVTQKGAPLRARLFMIYHNQT